MNPEFLHEQAALYASGAMTAEEREMFEFVLEFDEPVRRLVEQLSEVSVAVTLAHLPAIPTGPSPGLKSRILGLIANHPQQATSDGFVLSDPNGLVQWVNPSFSAMCGYSLEELQGKKLGPILQGQATDLATVERMRQAVRRCQPCRENILNYHKDGSHYWVQIAITPILDQDGLPRWLVARERELPEPIAA